MLHVGRQIRKHTNTQRQTHRQTSM